MDRQYTKRKSTETFSYLSKSSFVDAISDVGHGGEDNALVRGNVEILLAVTGNLNHYHYHYLLRGKDFPGCIQEPESLSFIIGYTLATA